MFPRTDYSRDTPSGSKDACLAEESLDPRANNIGMLRLVFAVFVLFSHCYPLTQGTNDAEPMERATFGMATVGTLGVDGFFLLSGCLLTRSWNRSHSASDFVRKRLLRIYPGYMAAFVLSVVVGVLCSTPESAQYLHTLYLNNDQLMRNLLFMDYGVLDQEQVFRANPYPNVVNGSLWTLRFELQCYALLLAFGVLGLVGKKRPTVVLFGVCYALYVLNGLHLFSTSHKLVRFLTFFLLGSIVACRGSSASRISLVRTIVLLCVLAASTRSRPFFAAAYPLVYAQLVFGIAFARLAPGAGFFSRIDVSYGVYLYAFPIQQILVNSLSLRSPMMLFWSALPIVVIVAFGSWRFLEAPVLALKNGPEPEPELSLSPLNALLHPNARGRSLASATERMGS